MQGFNRYIPADYDPKKTSTLNSYQGKKHALGKRAKDIDKGVLVVRFELPFNIWCESCGNHIGAGVRYNAQKKKVGNYYSTPIYGFRCKCHLCSNWFEIRTDPQNAAYIVHEGAKKKDEDWDPQANGGYATIDTEAPSASAPPEDAFAATEKTIDQQTWAKKSSSRITELTDLADRQSFDPYAASQNLRRKFRAEKREMLEKQGRDEGLRERYGLDEGVDLGDEDDGDGDLDNSRGKWEAGRERAGLPVGDGDEDGLGNDGDTAAAAAGAGASVRAIAGTPMSKVLGSRVGLGAGARSKSGDLASALRTSTKRRYDPFADAADAFLSPTLSSPRVVSGNGNRTASGGGTAPKGRGKIHSTEGIEATPAKVRIVESVDVRKEHKPAGASVQAGAATNGLRAAPVAPGLSLLSGYDSDD